MGCGWDWRQGEVMIRHASCVWEFRDADHVSCLPAGAAHACAAGLAGSGFPRVTSLTTSATWSTPWDLTAFYAPYEGDGRRNAPYEPSMMVKVLI